MVVVAVRSALLASAAVFMLAARPVEAAPAQPAPAPRPVLKGEAGPDFGGLWENKSGVFFTRPNGVPNPPPVNAEYDARWRKAIEATREGRPINDPTADCLWPGSPRVFLTPYPIEYIFAKDKVVILYEWMSQQRHVWMDGRKHPDNLVPSYNGHAIGWWEGDTLVIDTVGLREDTIFEASGLAHSDAMHLVERVRLTGPDSLENELTIIDPKAFTRPWVITMKFQRHRDWQIMDYVCEENNRNPVSPTGKTLTLGPDGKPLDKDPS